MRVGSIAEYELTDLDSIAAERDFTAQADSRPVACI